MSKWVVIVEVTDEQAPFYEAFDHLEVWLKPKAPFDDVPETKVEHVVGDNLSLGRWIRDESGMSPGDISEILKVILTPKEEDQYE